MNAKNSDSEIATFSIKDELVPEPAENLNCFQKVRKFMKHITLEPCIFLYSLAFQMGEPMKTAVILDKVCKVKFNFSFEICNNLSSYKTEQIDVESETSRIKMFSDVIEHLTQILFVLYLGAWSDKYGRKLPLIISIVGGILFSCIMWVNVFDATLKPEFLIIAALPGTFTGGSTCFLMSIYAYASDITAIKYRLIRLTSYDIILWISLPCGILLSNVTIKNFGYDISFIIQGSIYAISILYIIIMVKEARSRSTRSNIHQEIQPEINSKLMCLCSCRNIKESVFITFQKRPKFGRLRIILTIIAFCLSTMESEVFSFDLLYTQLKFNWTYEQYTNWSAVYFLLNFLGMIILIAILNYKKDIEDEVYGIIGAISGAIFFLTLALANKGYIVYIGSFFGLALGIQRNVVRFIISKTVPNADSGKAFSVLGSLDSIILLICNLLYTFMYNTSINVFPGSIYMLNALFAFLNMNLFSISLWLKWKENSSATTYEEM